MATINLTWPDSLGDQKQGQPNYILFTARKRLYTGRENELGTVALPIPIGALASTYKANYENAALGIMGGIAAGAANRASGANLADYSKNLTSELLNSGKNAGKDASAEQVAETALAALPGGGALAKFKNNVLGTMKNPYQFVTYSGPEFRSFAMNWTMIPTSEGEALTIHKITKFFKKHVLPRRGDTASTFFEMPPTMEVEMKIHAEGKSTAINLKDGRDASGRVHRFARCVLTNTEVDFNGMGALVPTFYHDGYPTATKLTIGLQETELITADMVDKGF